MADVLLVTCSCGCENRVVLEKIDQPVACVACGNPLALDAPSRAGTTTSYRRGFTEELSPVDRMEEVRLSANRARAAFIESSEVRDTFMDESCSACGRELRGEWDRMESDAGILCYICANQATHGLPERLKARIAQEAALTALREASTHHVALPPSWRRPRQHRLQIWLTRGAALAFACTVLGLAIYYTFSDSGRPAGIAGNESTTVASSFLTPPELRKLSTGPWMIVRGWMVISAVLPAFLVMFLMRVMNSAVSARSFARNAGSAALAITPLLAIQLLGVVVELAMWTRPTQALFEAVLLGSLNLFVLFWLFFEFIEDSFLQGVALMVLVFALSQLAVPYLNAIVVRGLGLT